jgi:hypothetical protein
MDLLLEVLLLAKTVNESDQVMVDAGDGGGIVKVAVGEVVFVEETLDRALEKARVYLTECLRDKVFAGETPIHLLLGETLQ